MTNIENRINNTTNNVAENDYKVTTTDKIVADSLAGILLFPMVIALDVMDKDLERKKKLAEEAKAKAEEGLLGKLKRFIVWNRQ